MTRTHHEPRAGAGLASPTRRVQFLSAALCLAFACAQPSFAEVARAEVRSRVPVPGYDYERLEGRLFFALDPRHPQNAVIVDLDKAPANGSGRVEFSADFSLWRPTSGESDVALLDVVNRGRRSSGFRGWSDNEDPYIGDGLLFRRRYTIVAVGWEFDVAPGAGLLTIDAPLAQEQGYPIGGNVRAWFTPDRVTTSWRVGDLDGYRPIEPGGPDSMLTVREDVWAEAREVPRSQWQLANNVVSMPGGFEPGRVYELTYRTRGPRVGGVGFAAVRDVVAWLKHAAGAPVRPRHVIGFGNSQSGRFLRDFVYQGFNTDESGRHVFDGVIANIAGASRIDLNRRWAIPVTTAMYSATSFPFADVASDDPVSGVRDGLLDNTRARTHAPKLFLTNTDVEYWGGGRTAALVHATPDGMQDLEPGPNTRAYFLAGTQHSPASFPPPEPGIAQQRPNPTDYWWVMRGLLVAMEEWVTRGTLPPPSVVPRFADGTLVRADRVAFPRLPGVASPAGLTAGRRVANTFVTDGAGLGSPLPLLVPQVDADGNSLGGVRMPDVSVPLATLTGWNFRNAAAGATGRLVALVGSYVPFARTRAEREQRGDPRLSIAERYPSRASYLERVRSATQQLVAGRFLLPEDAEEVEARGRLHWDQIVGSPAPAESQSVVR